MRVAARHVRTKPAESHWPLNIALAVEMNKYRILLALLILSGPVFGKCVSPKEAYIEMKVLACQSYEHRAETEVVFGRDEKFSSQKKMVDEDIRKSSVVTAKPLNDVEVVSWFANGQWHTHMGKRSALADERAEYFFNDTESQCNAQLKDKVAVFRVLGRECCDTGRYRAACFTQLPILYRERMLEQAEKIEYSYEEFISSKGRTANK